MESLATMVPGAAGAAGRQDAGCSPTLPGGSRDDARELTAPEWRAAMARHEERADELTREHRLRRERGQAHPVYDFLFTYYPFKPSHLRRWSPGAGVRLLDGEGSELATRRGFRVVEGVVEVDAGSVLTTRAELIDTVERIVRGALARPARFGCFGMHEWAMVYRDRATRHALPLRLGPEGTDAVVEANTVACTHFDAFRFFTPDARPRNELQPTRERSPELEQAGCLHANMDLYKWCIKLAPLTPGELVLDAFELARDVRELDMRASPYDVTRYGLAPVRVEERTGKREYMLAQRGFMLRANGLRVRLLEAIEVARAAAAASAPDATPASAETPAAAARAASASASSAPRPSPLVG